MENQRLIWADSLKGFLILLVVLGHAIQGVYMDSVEDNHLWNIIYSFHMAAFFAVSGYFARFSIKNFESLRKRSIQLLIPYFAWVILKLLMTKNLSISSLIAAVLEPVSFWFLWVLFWVYIIFQISLYFHNLSKSHFNYMSLLFTFLLVGIMVVINTKVLGLHLISYYFLFYSLGYYMGCFHILTINSKKTLAFLIALWFFLAWGWSMHNLPSWMPVMGHIPVVILQMIYRFITAFVAIIVLLNIAPLVLSSKNPFNTYISRLGYYSLGIYVTHYLVIWYIAENICQYTLVSNIIAVTMTFAIGLIISLFMVWILRNNIYTAKFLLGKV